jgi:hypothetical protein
LEEEAKIEGDEAAEEPAKDEVIHVEKLGFFDKETDKFYLKKGDH